MQNKKHAIIIGAGPAGLTAAYELLQRTDIIPIVLEKSADIGGISKTINYKGNRIDIGGHRFFSKSDRVMNWWLNIMPVENAATAFVINYRNKSATVDTTHTGVTDKSLPEKRMLLRQRLSRIYFLKKFFYYPLQLSWQTFRQIGAGKTFAILVSYTVARLQPIRPEKTLEEFLINRFGKKLYQLFFKDYTEKVWGVPCAEISAAWGAQRIKGVSISKALQHALQTIVKKKQRKHESIQQKATETSLIEKFLYPRYGPGELWEEVASRVQAMGGSILMEHEIISLHLGEHQLHAVDAIDHRSGSSARFTGNYFFSTMPVKELISKMDGTVPEPVKMAAGGLQYRDFITVGLLLKKFSATAKNGASIQRKLEDTWIYIQDSHVKVGRLQIFNNWSPFMVADPSLLWIGLEYFCNSTDSFWQQPDEAIVQCAISELQALDLAIKEDILDATVLRMEKAYPAYFGTYDQFDNIRSFTDQFSNLFLVGRNGMHKYNNADHSMLTAMVAVDNIIQERTDKSNIWAINTEQEYHEQKDSQQ